MMESLCCFMRRNSALVHVGSNGNSGELTQSKESGTSGISFSLLKKRAVHAFLQQAGENRLPYTKADLITDLNAFSEHITD